MSSKKWIAAIVIVLIAILIAWEWRRIPAVTISPAAAPAIPVPAPVASEAKPEPPLVTTQKPLMPPQAPAKLPKKQSVIKKIAAVKSPVKAAPPPTPVTRAPIATPPPPEPPPPAPLEWKGNDTAITHVGEIVIRNDHQWIQFWAEHHPDEAAPDVDFSQEMVVGVFAGPRPAEQFKIRIENVRTLPDSLVVDYREQLPPPGTFAVDVTVYPYHVKVIPKTTLKVKFNKLELINPNR